VGKQTTIYFYGTFHVAYYKIALIEDLIFPKKKKKIDTNVSTFVDRVKVFRYMFRPSRDQNQATLQEVLESCFVIWIHIITIYFYNKYYLFVKYNLTNTHISINIVINEILSLKINKV
jgi:hypothetical protein